MVIRRFDLRRPIYGQLSCYGHFGGNAKNMIGYLLSLIRIVVFVGEFILLGLVFRLVPGLVRLDPSRFFGGFVFKDGAGFLRVVGPPGLVKLGDDIFFRGLIRAEALGIVGAATGKVARTHLGGGGVVVRDASAGAALGPIGLFGGGAALLVALLFLGLHFLFAGVGVLLGLAQLLQALGFQTFGLQFLFTFAALLQTHRVLFVQLLAIMDGEVIVAGNAEHAVGDPVDAQGGGHEIRTPLNAILGYAELLLTGGTLPPEAAADIRRIADAGNTLLEIVNNILDLSKVESGQFVIRDDLYETKKLVDELSGSTILRIKDKPISFSAECADDLPPYLYGDAVLVKQIIMMKSKNARAIVKLLLGLALAAGIFWGAWAGIQKAGQALLENGLETTEDNLRRGAVACYALEGSYPDTLDYLMEHYNVTVDESKYIVYYSIFASNIMDRVNHNYSKHIITIEDPIEFIYENDRCIFTQREVGTDTAGYAAALRASLRQSPDVILVGEMRDYDTIKTALTAAETGHLIFSTLHTVGIGSTVNRIIDIFPPDQQQQIRVQLASQLCTVVTQELVRTVDGALAPVFEVVQVNSALRNMALAVSASTGSVLYSAPSARRRRVVSSPSISGII